MSLFLYLCRYITFNCSHGDSKTENTGTYQKEIETFFFYTCSYLQYACKLKVINLNQIKELCIYVQETKRPKRSPLTLSMVVLVFATICILHIFSIRTRQTNLLGQNFLTSLRIDDTQKNLCRNSTKTLDLDSPYLHFPHPQTFKRLNIYIYIYPFFL